MSKKLWHLSFLFLVVADFFLVFANTIDNWKIDFSPFGAAGFLFAYLCLIVAYQKNFKVGKEEILTGFTYPNYFSVCSYVFAAICEGVHAPRSTNIWGGTMLHDLDIDLHDF